MGSALEVAQREQESDKKKDSQGKLRRKSWKMPPAAESVQLHVTIQDGPYANGVQDHWPPLRKEDRQGPRRGFGQGAEVVRQEQRGAHDEQISNKNDLRESSGHVGCRRTAAKTSGKVYGWVR